MSLDNSGKASEKQNNIIKAWFYTDIFQLHWATHSSFEPFWWEAGSHSGEYLRVVFPSTEGRGTKFFGISYVFGSGSMELALSVLLCLPSIRVPRGRLWEGVWHPQVCSHLQGSILNLGVSSLGPALWVGGGYGTENKKTFIKNLARQPLPAPKFLPK